MRMAVVGLVVVATAAGCSAEPPLSSGAIARCFRVDSTIAVPADSAVLENARRRCLQAAGVLR